MGVNVNSISTPLHLGRSISDHPIALIVFQRSVFRQLNSKTVEMEIHKDEKPSPSVEGNISEDVAKGTAVDESVEQFYGSSTTAAYRLKSEVVGRCMDEIGMGK